MLLPNSSTVWSSAPKLRAVPYPQLIQPHDATYSAADSQDKSVEELA